MITRGIHGNFAGMGTKIDILPFSRRDGDSMISITAVMGIEILLLPQ